MSCLVSEARKEAGMAAEKIHGVRKGGRRPAAWILVLTNAALPEPGAGGVTIHSPRLCNQEKPGKRTAALWQASSPEDLPSKRSEFSGLPSWWCFPPGEAAVYQKGTFVPFASGAACLHVLEFYYSKNKCHLFD
ncbi:hypothetical protein CapIbe_021401 [Capra ibex]